MRSWPGRGIRESAPGGTRPREAEGDDRARRGRAARQVRPEQADVARLGLGSADSPPRAGRSLAGVLCTGLRSHS